MRCRMFSDDVNILTDVTTRSLHCPPGGLSYELHKSEKYAAFKLMKLDKFLKVAHITLSF